MTDLITRIRHVEDTAQWIDSSTGEIVEAVKLSDLQAVPMDDLADCAHQLNEALDARDAAVAHVRDLEGQLLRALAPAAPAADSDAAAYRRGLTDAAGIVAAQCQELTTLNSLGLDDYGLGRKSGFDDAEDAIRRAGGVV